MVKDILLGVLGGFAGSAFLYDPLHKRSVPELARYVAGGIIVLAVVALIGDEDELGAALKAFVGVAIGVGMNRLRRG